MTVGRERSQQFRQTTRPYPHAKLGVQLEFDSVGFDGGESRPLELKQNDKTVQLYEHRTDWSTCRLEGTLTLPSETVEKVFPEIERDAPPGHLYVALRSPETIYRTRIDVTRGPTPADEYDVIVDLERARLRGEIELAPYLTRAEPGAAEDTEFAAAPNTELATGRNWRVVVDAAADAAERNPTIDGHMVSFRNTDHLPQNDGLYYLDLRDPGQPTLWINTDHSRVAGVLESSGSVGAEARLRDVILDQMSYAVWTRLILHAGGDVDETGYPEHEWQDTILKMFVRDMYRTDDLRGACRQLKADMENPRRVSEVVGRIDTELQNYLNPRQQLIHLMEEGLEI
jgi:hypothetical protein